MKKLLFLCIIALLAASCDKGPQATGNEQDKPSEDVLVPSTAMPVINIVTDNNAQIVSKDDYIKANVTVTTADGVTTDVMRTNIRGRGNSSWYNAEKKSYRLKFEEKQSLLGRGKDKSWSLIANYFDKTLLRNELAFHMSRKSRLAYTPATDYVEVYLNGSYEGVYVLCDHLKTGSHRMDADYLMEIDVRAEDEDIQVHLQYLGQPVVVKDPDDISYQSEEYTYISGFLTAAENALYSTSYTSPETGYRQYFDLDSFIDWYLINEIAKNNDAVLYTSCYMNHNEGGKLCMGPVWDFDIAFGNVNYNDNDNPQNLWINRSSWYHHLLSDPAFEDKVKERFMFYYNMQDELCEFIDDYAEYLKPYIDKNEERWQTLNKFLWPNPVVFETYQEHIDSLKSWLKTRLEWMKENYGL